MQDAYVSLLVEKKMKLQGKIGKLSKSVEVPQYLVKFLCKVSTSYVRCLRQMQTAFFKVIVKWRDGKMAILRHHRY